MIPRQADIPVDGEAFEAINRGYNNTFHLDRLSLGLIAPLENYSAGGLPTMSRHEDFPAFDNHYGRSPGAIDMLPKPTVGKIPSLITGGSQQSPVWIAANGEGWITYPRNVAAQSQIIKNWRDRVKAAGGPAKPAAQALYIDLLEDPDATPRPIHLGFSSGVNYLRDYLNSLQAIGINHVALNLRFNQANIETTLKTLADELLAEFSREKQSCKKPY